MSHALATTRGLLVCLATLAALAACEDEPSTRATEAVTFERDIGPLLARRCLGCHAEGGPGGVRLDGYEHARDHAVLALGAIESGLMPPWLPSDDCHPLEGERRVSDPESSLLASWIAAGFPRGKAPAPTASDPATQAPRFTPNETLIISDGYEPDPTLADDYHCFIIDRDFPEETYVTASQVLPGSGAVHHILVYAIAPSQLGEVGARDAAHPGPGYPCFAQPVSTGFADQQAFIEYLAGGELPNFDFPDQLGAWVPGTLPRVLPDGLAYLVPAGAKLVVQIHYGATGRSPDTTTLLVTTSTRPPTSLLHTRPLAILDLDIPAGARGVTQTRAFPYHAQAPLEIVGVMAHMHLLGRGFRAAVLPAPSAAQTPEACLLDIARWDFHWQEGYMFPEDAPVMLPVGGALELTCTYDNGPEDQPLDAAGVRQPPRHVTWGEGTRDEMCLFYHTSKHPFAPPAPPRVTECDSAAACLERCRDADAPSLSCVLECSEARTECQLCGVRAALQCSRFTCLSTLVDATDCMVSCLESSLMLGGNLGRCLSAECPTAYDAALTCLDASLVDQACDAGFLACGIDLR